MLTPPTRGAKHQLLQCVGGRGPPGRARERPAEEGCFLSDLDTAPPLSPLLPSSRGGPCQCSRAVPRYRKSYGWGTDSQCHQGWPHPPQRTLTHLREQTVWTGLRNRDRQLLVWKSQRRSMLEGRAWAEASRELLPSNARAETWGGGRLREVVRPAGASHPWARRCPPCQCDQGRSIAPGCQCAGPR